MRFAVSGRFLPDADELTVRWPRSCATASASSGTAYLRSAGPKEPRGNFFQRRTGSSMAFLDMLMEAISPSFQWET